MRIGRLPSVSILEVVDHSDRQPILPVEGLDQELDLLFPKGRHSHPTHQQAVIEKSASASAHQEMLHKHW